MSVTLRKRLTKRELAWSKRQSGRKSGKIQHDKAVAYWSTIDWSLSNKEIAKRTKKSYCLAWMWRKFLAPETLGKRVMWKPKILELVRKEKDFIVADGFVQQSAARVAGYALGVRLTQQTRKNRSVALSIASF